MKARLVEFGYGIGDYTCDLIREPRVPQIGQIFTINLTGYEDFYGPFVNVHEPLYRADGSLMNDNAINICSFEIIEG